VPQKGFGLNEQTPDAASEDHSRKKQMTHTDNSPVRYLTGLAPVVLLSAVLMLVSAAGGSAQVIERGVQGALIGAGIGAITGGGKGAGKGALIGGAAGAVVGGIEKSNRERYEPPPEPVYHAAPPPRYAPGPSYSRTVHDIQRELVRLGYDPGPIDGQYGRGTANAITMYQEDNNLLVDGQATQPLLKHMIQQGSRG